MNAGAGGCMNPIIGLVQSIYMIGLDNRSGLGVGTSEAKYMWLYIAGPLTGALFACLFYKLHDYIEHNEYKQNQPMQFIGLLR